MKNKICVSIIPATVNEALELIEKAEKHEPGFIEVRLDCINEHNELPDVAGCTKIPLIAANRARDHKGKFVGSETKRWQMLFDAAKSGFKYVDVELSAVDLKNKVESLRQIDVKPIISFHEFEKTPGISEMQKILKLQVENGAEICKIVTTALTVEDNLTLLTFLSQACEISKLICFAMGPLGKISRVLSPLFGGFFTIASLERSKETAPSQMTVKELKAIYQMLGVWVK